MMRTAKLVFYSFFFLFNISFIVYNVLTGFNWAEVLFPALIALACLWIMRSIVKEGS
ncbi:hypothetical protein ACVR1I_10075 [Streptococcus cameli]